MTLTWTEAVVETIAQDEDCVGWGELRHYEDQRFDYHFRVAVALCFFGSQSGWGIGSLTVRILSLLLQGCL